MREQTVTSETASAVFAPDLDLARRFLARRPPPGRLVLCAVTGAHLYGFASVDSDLDLKGIHLTPTRSLLGFAPSSGTHDPTGVLDGVECDLTTNEAAVALGLLAIGNGNMAERILSPWQLVESTELRDLQGLTRATLSRRFARHYAGFFQGCRQEHQRRPTLKTLLYCYRVALTGVHLLPTGRLVPHLPTLADEHGLPDVHELIAAAAAGAEHGPLEDDLDQFHRARWPHLEAELATAEARSPLPEDATTVDDLQAWLVETRLRDLH